MAKYIATSGSYFEPFTYDQLVAPVQQATDAMNTTADAYDEMNLEANALEEYLKKEPNDSRARDMYDSYMTQLNNLQNELWNNGYSAAARRGLTSARQGYASNIVRLQKAITDRQARSKEYWDTRHKNPDMIMGSDPGLSGLDNYLNDDLYGQNYFSYNGADFMNAMAADAKARAAEYLSMGEVQRNPELFGYLFRIERDGFTNDEVNRAVAAARNKMTGVSDADYNNLDGASKILADTLISGINQTGAVRGQNVSEDEFDRFFDYGMRGLSQGVGKPTVKQYEDVIGKTNLEFEDWKRRQGYSAQLKAAEAAAKKEEEENGRIYDTDTVSLANPKAASANRKLTRKLDSNKNINLTTKSGVALGTSAEASDVVFSGDVRRQAYEVLGFDVGRSQKRGIVNARSSDSFIGGTVVKDGVTYETRYNPQVKYNDGKGAVQYRTGGGQWYISPKMTQVYNDARKLYEDNLAYYKKNERSVYDAATIDPDKQYRIYSRDNSSFSIPLSEYESKIRDTPKYTTGTTTYTYMARNGSDPGGYAQRMADILSSSITKNKKGNPTKAEGWRGYDGQFEYIHPMTKYGTVDRKTMKNPNDVFTFDKGKDDSNNTNRITNVKNVRLDADAILNNYIIFDVSDSNTPYAVGVGMFNSNQISGIFETSRNALDRVINDPYIDHDVREEEKQKIVNTATRMLQDSVGYDMNTQSQGGTSQENRN